MDSPDQIAAIARTHWGLGFITGILVVTPVPSEDEIPSDEINGVIEDALNEAKLRNITGKSVTPFLLSQIAERTASGSLMANIALLKNNAKIAGEIACALITQE